MNTSFTMVVACAVVLMLIGFLFARPLLVVFGASKDALVYAYPYFMIYLIGTLPSMIATGMNPFINAQGYSLTGMLSNCRRSYCQSPIRSIIYFCFGLWCAGCRDCNCDFSISVGCICTVFPDKKIRIKGSILEKGRICRMHRLCKKYRKPWNSRFYHAVDKQSCIYLLQQYSVECRWRYLHISHDNRIERSPIG